METLKLRVGPRHPRLAKAGYRLTRWLAEAGMARSGFHRSAANSHAGRSIRIRERLQRGETVYLAGLRRVRHAQHRRRADRGHAGERSAPRSSTTRKSAFPATSTRPNIRGNRSTRWSRRCARWGATSAISTPGRHDLGLSGRCSRRWRARCSRKRRTASGCCVNPASPAIDRRRLDQMTADAENPRAGSSALPKHVPLICMPHHDNHAWFSFAASPFADDDGAGRDRGARRHRRPGLDLALCRRGWRDAPALLQRQHVRFTRRVLQRDLIDPGRLDLALQRGPLHGRRRLGRHEPRHQSLLCAAASTCCISAPTAKSGSTARWPTGTAIPSTIPTSAALIEILGEPLKPEQLWNPDAVLRVEDIHHRPDTKDRLDKAAATQLVFEDAMIHVVDHLLRATGASRLVLTGGVALNALGNMRLLEHFDEAWFASRAAAQGAPASVGAAGARRSRRHHRRGLAVRASGRRAARRADDARVLLRHAAVAARNRGGARGRRHRLAAHRRHLDA